MTHHTLDVVLHDATGGLQRTATLLRRRSVRFVSLALARSETPGKSRLTLVVNAADAVGIARQLDGLIDVVSVRDVTAGAPVPDTACNTQADGVAWSDEP